MLMMASINFYSEILPTIIFNSSTSCRSNYWLFFSISKLL